MNLVQMLSETEALQSLGQAIFAFMLSNMTITPVDDQINICVLNPNNKDMHCAEIPRENMCELPMTYEKYRPARSDF